MQSNFVVQFDLAEVVMQDLTPPFSEVPSREIGGPMDEMGSVAEGAYVEFDLPENAILANVGPGNTMRIPTDTPLPIGGLNPKIVKRPWWKFW